MKSLRRSIAVAVLVTLLVGNNAQAQSATEIQAGALLQSAERLQRDNNDLEAITRAYGQALAAYDELGDTEQSLGILETLYRVNYSACQYDEAVQWAREAVSRYVLPQRDFKLNDRLLEYARWVNQLGELYRTTEQPEQALDLYNATLENLDTLAPSVGDNRVFETKAGVLRSQLALYPSDSRAAAIAQQRLLAIRERLGVITEVNGLISDAIFLRDKANNNYATAAVELLQRVLEQSRLNNYLSGQIKAVTLLSQQFLANEDYDQAIIHGNLTLTRFNQLDGAEPWLADARYVLAQAEQAVGNDAEAIQHYSTLLAEIDSEPDYTINASKYDVVTNLISLYERVGDTAQASRLTTEHSDLLKGLFAIRPLPTASAIPRSVLLRPYIFRTCFNPVRSPSGVRERTPIVPIPPVVPTPRPSQILSPD